MQYDICDTVLQVSCELPQVSHLIRKIFWYIGLPEINAPSLKPHLRFSFSISPTPLSSVEATQPLPIGTGLQTQRSGKYILLHAAHASATLDTAAGMGSVHLSPPLQGRSHALRQSLFLLLLSGLPILLRSRSLYALHAAALIGKERGILFPAASGCGKSTLAYSLVRQGWRYLSDDHLLLRPCSTHVEAVPFRGFFSLDRAAQTSFPELATAGPEAAFRDHEKVYLSMDAMYPSQKADRCVPEVLLFPEIVERTESRVVPISKPEAMRRLLEQSGPVMLEPDGARLHLDLLRRLLVQTQHYRLLAGQDLKKKPALIAEMLGEVLGTLPRRRA